MGSRMKCGGIFTPEQIDELREELKRGNRPDESMDEREERAIEILNRRNVERVNNEVRIRTMRTRHQSKNGVLKGMPLASDSHRFQ
ncbi:MAG: hypothetical protein KL801_06290 [Mesorhizobium sp.]|nr:hypothetical protein [Mesorhizobium sp.]